MPLRERNSLVGVSVAVLLVLCGFVILSPTDSGRRNLAPNRLSSISHYTATDSKRERVSGDGALLKESSAIGGRESSMLDLDAPGKNCT